MSFRFFAGTGTESLSAYVPFRIGPCRICLFQWVMNVMSLKDRNDVFPLLLCSRVVMEGNEGVRFLQGGEGEDDANSVKLTPNLDPVPLPHTVLSNNHYYVGKPFLYQA